MDDSMEGMPEETTEDYPEFSVKERERNYQKEYYRKNKERLQAYRSKKYEKDPNYKEKASARANRRYWLKTRQETLKPLPTIELPALDVAGSLSILVEDEGDPRCGIEVKVNVFTSSAVATLMGRTGQTVRIWEKQGVLPTPTYRGSDFPGHYLGRGRNPRLYTEDEMRILERARPKMTLPRKTLVDSVFAQEIRDGFARLQKGVEPQRREGRTRYDEKKGGQT